MSQHFSTHDGSAIVADLVSVIVANREYLSEVDGAIGDGDHGINMAKGFAHCGRTIEGRQLTLGIPVAASLIVLSWLLTGWYVRSANTRFDAMSADLLEELK